MAVYPANTKTPLLESLCWGKALMTYIWFPNCQLLLISLYYNSYIYESMWSSDSGCWTQDQKVDSHCWSGVEVSAKFLIPYCLCPPSSDGYLVEQKIAKLWMVLVLAAENALNSPQRRWDSIRGSSNTKGVNCKVSWTHWDIRLYLHFQSFLMLHLLPCA